MPWLHFHNDRIWRGLLPTKWNFKAEIGHFLKAWNLIAKVIEKYLTLNSKTYLLKCGKGNLTLWREFCWKKRLKNGEEISFASGRSCNQRVNITKPIQEKMVTTEIILTCAVIDKYIWVTIIVYLV